MIEVQNAHLLGSQQALGELLEQPLSGLHALNLKEVMDAVHERLQKMQEVRQKKMEEVETGQLSQEEADEQWREVLESTLEIDEEPLPRAAFKNIEVSAQTLIALDWLIEDANA